MPPTRAPAQPVTDPPEVPVVIVDPVLPTPEPRHALGCPAQRIELFASPGPSGILRTVSRCIDCGEQVLVA
jgi:hypothetical protein